MGLGNLTSLMKLTLLNYSSLTTLREGLGNLTSLQNANSYIVQALQHYMRDLKISFFFCRSLICARYHGCDHYINFFTKLYLLYCIELLALAKRLGNLTCLIVLNLWGCSCLIRLPKGLEKLTSLMRLNLL